MASAVRSSRPACHTCRSHVHNFHSVSVVPTSVVTAGLAAVFQVAWFQSHSVTHVGEAALFQLVVQKGGYCAKFEADRRIRLQTPRNHLIWVMFVGCCKQHIPYVTFVQTVRRPGWVRWWRYSIPYSNEKYSFISSDTPSLEDGPSTVGIWSECSYTYLEKIAMWSMEMTMTWYLTVKSMTYFACCNVFVTLIGRKGIGEKINSQWGDVNVVFPFWQAPIPICQYHGTASNVESRRALPKELRHPSICSIGNAFLTFNTLFHVQHI